MFQFNPVFDIKKMQKNFIEINIRQSDKEFNNKSDSSIRDKNTFLSNFRLNVNITYLLCQTIYRSTTVGVLATYSNSSCNNNNNNNSNNNLYIYNIWWLNTDNIYSDQNTTGCFHWWTISATSYFEIKKP